MWRGGARGAGRGRKEDSAVTTGKDTGGNAPTARASGRAAAGEGSFLQRHGASSSAGCRAVRLAGSWEVSPWFEP